MRIGVIGVGIMGSAIARNLIRAGMTVTGFDIDTKRRAELAAMGGTAAGSAAEVAAGAEIVLTSLPAIAALDETVAAILSAKPRELIVAELSTLPIEVKQRNRDALAKGGVAMLDCPLSGTGAQAVTGDLVVYQPAELYLGHDELDALVRLLGAGPIVEQEEDPGTDLDGEEEERHSPEVGALASVLT